MASVVQALGWVALLVALGLEGDESLFTWVFLVASVLGFPFLALWPSIRLGPGGELVVRGWTKVRRAQAREIVRLSMTQYGLQFTFADGSQFTSVIFQATQYLRRPRVLDFVETLTGSKNLAAYNPWDVAKSGAIELYPPRAE